MDYVPENVPTEHIYMGRGATLHLDSEDVGLDDKTKGMHLAMWVWDNVPWPVVYHMIRYILVRSAYRMRWPWNVENFKVKDYLDWLDTNGER